MPPRLLMLLPRKELLDWDLLLELRTTLPCAARLLLCVALFYIALCRNTLYRYVLQYSPSLFYATL